MDRLMSDEERIRRAEEVAKRRQNSELELGLQKNKRTTRRKANASTFLSQIIICLLIYCTFYYLKNSQDNNKKENAWIEKIKTTLNYDIDFKQAYLNFISWCGINNKDEQQPDSNDKSQNENNENQQGSLNESPEQSQGDQSEHETLGIGGEYTSDVSTNQEENAQVVDDIDYITNNLQIINPLEDGVVTSRYGEREASSIVSANHKGIDLGAPTGSTIISASDGKVVYVSSKGDFGNHVKIQSGDYLFIYAHCSKLNVKEGESVQKGQKIAEVGATGRTTGPHLHFEIRRGERAINPELIMNFEK